MGIKRYRLARFKLGPEVRREYVTNPEKYPANVIKQIMALAKAYVRDMVDRVDLETAFERFIQLEKPGLRIAVSVYQDYLQEAEFCYLIQKPYPAATAAGCIGEMILNDLILRLRDDYRNKWDPEIGTDVFRKDSFQDWPKAVDILRFWNVIDGETKDWFLKLNKKRNELVHHGLGLSPAEVDAKALEMLNLINRISDRLFGVYARTDIFFWVPGEPYVREPMEEDPLVKEFIIPSCLPLSYKHSIEWAGGGHLEVTDHGKDEKGTCTDDEFVQLREDWRKENL